MSDDLEQRLTTGLRARAGAVSATRTPAGAIAARAHVVRRSRRRRALAGAVGGVLAVVAVMALTQRDVGRSTGGLEPATAPASAPSVTVSPDVARPTGLADLPLGRGPGTGVVTGTAYSEFTMTDPDRSIRIPPLARYDVVSVTAFAGGLLVGDDFSFEGSSGLRLVTNDGQARDLGPCTAGGGAASRDRTRAAWVSYACGTTGVPAPTLLHEIDAAGDERTTPLDGLGPNTDFLRVAGFTDDLVVLTTSDGRSAVVGRDGAATAIPDVDGVLGVDETTGAVSAFLDAQRACAVLDPTTGETRFTSSREWPLDDFSPDGSRVLAYRSHADGRLEIRVLDALTGEVRHEFSPPAEMRNDVYSTPVWADDDHLLLVLEDGTGHAVVRADLDGHLERATDVYPSTTPLLLAH